MKLNYFLFIALINVIPCTCFGQKKVDSLYGSQISSITSAQPDTLIVLKPGKSIQVDGIISPNEWTDANSVIIKRSSDWVITVFYKFNKNNLYFAFTNMVNNGNEVVAEILIDTDIHNDTLWHNTTTWLHSSYNLCEGKGEYYNWQSRSKTEPDWEANLLPYNDVEFRIDLSKFITQPNSRDTLRIAFDVGDRVDHVSYWPDRAHIAHPSTWGYLVFPGSGNTGISNDKKR